MSRPSARPLDVSYISSCYIERRVLLGCGSVFEVRQFRCCTFLQLVYMYLQQSMNERNQESATSTWI